MCNNYRTASPGDLRAAWGVEPPSDLFWDAEVWPHGDAVMIRRPEGGSHGDREARGARFGLVPFGAKTEHITWDTMNARIETAPKLYSYRRAWARSQWCIVPAWSFYEPFYETAKSTSVRWSIARSDGQMVGIAGLWDRWVRPDGTDLISFTMLTRNCDEHPVLGRFHRWFDKDGKPVEKRTPVLLYEDEYDDWLATAPEEVERFSKLLPENELHSVPAPAAPRRKAAKAPEGGLFNEQ